MANTKHYVLTSITLGIIAASSALLIGASNIATKDRIEKNALEKVNSGIAAIFSDSTVILKQKEFGEEYKYVKKVYEVGENEMIKGYAFETSGSNMYGKLSLLIGITTSNEFIGVQEIVDEQTYAKDLRNHYYAEINPDKDGIRKRDFEDVTCGATYGAKLSRDMINESIKASKEKVWENK